MGISDVFQFIFVLLYCVFINFSVSNHFYKSQ